MQALVLEGINQKFQLKEVDKPILKSGEALVKIKAAAFNRRDYWITKGQYAGLKFPIILGSDGCGLVTEVFDKTHDHWQNQEVVINPGTHWGENPHFQSAEFKILGLPEDGTFAEFVKVKVENLYKKPAHLNYAEAAAFPLAGLTAYRALFTKARLQKTDKVLIVGIGGGAATFVLQWALAFGVDVYVTSSSEEKIKKAVALGAKGGVNYTHENWDQQLKELSGGIDVIIDSAVGDGFAKHLTYINAGGRIVFFGATAGDMPVLNSRIVFWKQLQILGTTMGTNAEFKAMHQFISDHQIVPIIDEVFTFEKANEAIALMENSSQFGKIVLER
jgi:zinc-binding alcohol dehydrogenase/oxidoreductase